MCNNCQGVGEEGDEGVESSRKHTQKKQSNSLVLQFLFIFQAGLILSGGLCLAVGISENILNKVEFYTAFQYNCSLLIHIT